MSRNSDEAVGLFSQGYNCAQCVLAACGGSLGLPREIALRVAGSFGGGIGRLGGTCGAVSGAYMAIGLKHAKVKPEDDAEKEKGYALAREFAARFTGRHKSTCCRELLGCDLSTPEGMNQARERKLFKTLCPVLVRDAVEIVDALLAAAQDASSPDGGANNTAHG